jgi:hypothetical protein
MPYRKQPISGVLFLFLPFLVAAQGCSLKAIGVRTTADILEDGIVAFEAESDVTLAHEAAGSQIKLLEALHRAAPSDRKVLLSLARAFGSYAFAFLDREAEKDPSARARAAALYGRGADYGMKLLELRLGKGTTRDAREGTLEAWEKRLAKSGPADVPALFWTAYDWAGGIRKSADSPAAVAGLPRVVAMIERVLTLKPDYHFGAPLLFMGVYYADRPRLAGGNPTKARDYFSQGLKVSDGKYVMGKYLWARFGAVQAQDPKLFESLLREVIESPADLLPAQRMAQETARIWARDLLKDRSDYFAEE